MQHKLKYDTGVAIQDNAAQHWWYSTILMANTISNTGKLSKMVHPDFFGEEPSSLRLRKLISQDVVFDEDMQWQTIHSTFSLILSLSLLFP